MVTTPELGRGRYRPGRVLRPSYFQVLTLDLDLLKHECFSRLFGRAYIHESVVPIACDPAPQDRVSILEHPDRATQFLEGRIKHVHQLVSVDVLRNISNVELALGLILRYDIRVGRVLSLVLIEDLGSRHLLLRLSVRVRLRAEIRAEVASASLAPQRSPGPRVVIVT